METACQWFVRCDRGTAQYLDHPVLGPVPCCPRCAKVVGAEADLKVIPEAWFMVRPEELYSDVPIDQVRLYIEP